MTSKKNTLYTTMKTDTKKTCKKKYTTDYEFWLKHKDEYIYINKLNKENDTIT